MGKALRHGVQACLAAVHSWCCGLEDALSLLPAERHVALYAAVAINLVLAAAVAPLQAGALVGLVLCFGRSMLATVRTEAARGRQEVTQARKHAEVLSEEVSKLQDKLQGALAVVKQRDSMLFQRDRQLAEAKAQLKELAALREELAAAVARAEYMAACG